MRRWRGAGVFLIYVLFLIGSGIAMLVMASAMRGQTTGRRVWYAVFGAGFTLYGLYLLLFFPGGHYLLFYYAFILPVLATVGFFRDRSAFRAKQQAAALQGPPPGYAQPPGYAAKAAEAAGLAPGGTYAPTGPGDAGSGPQMTADDIGAPAWAAGTPPPSETTGGFPPMPADVIAPEPSQRHRRIVRLTAAGVVVVTVVSVAAVALVISSANKPVAARARGRTPTSAAHAPAAQWQAVLQLRAGDCLQGPPDINTTTVRPDAVMLVPCADAHLAEVYFASANYWPATMAFPGNATIIHQAGAECRKAFRAYDGIPSSQSQYAYTYWYPLGAADWYSGDRLVFCTAYDWASSNPRGNLLYASIKGSDF